METAGGTQPSINLRHPPLTGVGICRQTAARSLLLLRQLVPGHEAHTNNCSFLISLWGAPCSLSVPSVGTPDAVRLMLLPRETWATKPGQGARQGVERHASAMAPNLDRTYS